MKLLHFARKPLDGGLELREQQPGGASKPRGLWVSDESQFNGWRWWCEGMEWYDRLAHAYAVTLAEDARVLTLAPHDLEDFAAQFAAKAHCFGGLVMGIDWPSVAQRWQGVILTPYHRDVESMALMWAYSFDCASGCIWDPAAVASVEPVES